MRWKLIALVILLAVFAALGGAGWYQWQQIQRQKELAENMRRAKNYMELEQHESAQKAFTNVLENYPEIPEEDRAAILANLAKSYEATGQKEDALEIWEQIFGNHPGSLYIPEALIKLAEAAYDAQEDSEARKYFTMLIEKFPRSDYLDDAKYGLIRLEHLEKGRISTRDALRDLLDEFPDSDRREEIEKILGKINLDILFSPGAEQTGKVKEYRVKRGDTLNGIGLRYGISPDLLTEINRIPNPKNLTIGKRLFIPQVDFSIVVDKSTNSLMLYNEGKFFKRYPVRTGKHRKLTPTDSFRIQSKVKNPPWNKPGGQTYAPGDPENALGTRWMAFDSTSGLGIHGTNNPDTIGTYASEGCVGMYNEDVEELFNLVPIGTIIEIKGKKQENGEKERL